MEIKKNTVMKQKRISLWTAPRSCSTLFYRAINNAPGIKSIFEPFSTADSFGEERRMRCDSGPEPQKGYTFRDITSMLNQPFPGYDTVFVKDMAYKVMGAPYSLDRLLPTGYTHTFLIRNPRKLFPSLYKVFLRPDLVDRDVFNSKLTVVKGLYDMYIHVTKHVCERTLIIDADDLLENPEEVLKAYCQYVGIPFHQCMVDWSLADPSRFEAFQDSIKFFDMVWLETATESTTFHKNKSEPDLSSLPELVHDAIQRSMPLYEELYEKRLKFD